MPTALLLMMAWQTFPLIQAELLGMRAKPREITPRGDLAAAATANRRAAKLHRLISTFSVFGRITAD
ncbi:hypothetical protein [Bradyrhizobium oligotrophicum]|uniref:hypothetical protein n=1 Tax=Bradyrhizobium oligotrophicum TaxID=44255 RepID=UPI003EB6DA85